MKAEAIAVGETGGTGYGEGTATDFFDCSYKFAYGLGGVRRKDIRLTAMQEMRGIAPVEGLAEVGLEGIGAAPQGSSLVAVRMTADDVVESFAVGCRHVLHVGDVLQATFNLERRGPRINQLLQVVAEVQILERQEVTVVLQDTALGIQQVERHAADLGTGTTIGRTSEAILGDVTLAGIADAEGAVNEDLQRHVGHLAMDGGNLVNRQLTRQDHTTETQLLQLAHLLSGTVIGLRGGVQGNGRQRLVEQLQVLYQDGIDSRLI